MAGMTKKPIDINIDKGKELEYVNELNKFYARFDNHDFSQQIQTCFSNVDNSVPSFDIEPFEVFKLFCKLKPNKACGADGVTPKILKLCARQLSFIYCTIFNISLNA